MNRLKTLNFLVLLLLESQLNAQIAIGYHGSNYAGLQSMMVNPTSIIESPYRYDINLINWDMNLSNNYLRVDTDMFSFNQLRNPIFDSLYNNNFQQFRVDQLQERDVDAARMHQHGYAMGPSFGFSIGKNAFAITTAVREYFFIDNLEASTAQMIMDELENPSLQNIDLDNQRFNTVGAAWTEIGIAYGREVWSNGEHTIKAAGHLKLPIGGYSGYFYADSLVVNFPNADSINVVLSDIRFGYSDNFQDLRVIQGNDTIRQSLFDGAQALFNRVGFNMDMGFTYEWRPSGEKYRSTIDNPYKLKVGVSLLDLGVVRFNRGTYGANFDDVAINWDLNTIDLNGVPDFGQLMRDSFNMTENRDPYNLRLPTSLSLQVDYNLLMDLYVNFTAYMAFSHNDAPLRLHALNSWAMSVRWEHKWYDVALPLSLDGFANFNAGFAFRAGPLYMGSTNIFNFLFNEYVHGLNFYGGLKIPIFKKKKGGNAWMDFQEEAHYASLIEE